MNVIKRVMGYVGTNTYFLEKNGEMLVIDPCLDPNNDASKLFDVIGDHKVVGVLLTHAHFDHISGVDAICDKYKCPLYMNQSEIEWLDNPDLNLSYMVPETVIIKTKPTVLSLGNHQISNFDFEMIETKGHTRGSVSYVFDDKVFDGDFIFHLSVGRMDLPTGSESDMMQDISDFIERFATINPTLYPGHGNTTTLNKEIELNPYIRL